VLALALLGPACTSTPPPSASPVPATPVATGQPTPTRSPSAATSPTPSPTPPGTHGLDNQVDLAGLRHDSRDLLYRTPAAAVPAGTTVQLRFRTFHDDIESVKLRLFSVNAGEEQLIPMLRAADDVSCYEAALSDSTCDFWQATLGNAEPDNLWYRFIVSDGTATAYYADDTPALDGGVGAASAELVDNSYALTVYVPDFAVPAWASNTILYQIFPDRFRNGDTSNDPKTGDVRYDEPVLKLNWSDLPEGYCRGYADSATNCPWRFEDNPPSYSPTVEGPRGLDYMGGDLAGVTAELDYLQSLGVTAIYLNPIFDAGSNHGYDTQDYSKVDPYFGTDADFSALVAAAKNHGFKIILDGVFNHMSSDSPFFDRYGHYDTLGACESNDSPWRLWFTFTLGGVDGGPCAAPGGPGRMVYDSWFGFDSIPTINKIRPDVQSYFLDTADSVTRHWLELGARGWRMDVSGDPSFPDGYWEKFRTVVKDFFAEGLAGREVLTISETWQKDSALLRALRGDRFDTTMNYRLRDAVLGLLTPTTFDAKGFPDSGGSLAPSEFAQRLLSMQEDYPSPAYHSLMNLLDSHDTERALWALTPGDQTTAGRETDAANVAEGKQRLKLASLIQFTVPGMPSVYYGDEVGMTGQTDPDDRRTYPWADLGGTPDTDLMSHYQSLAGLRRDVPALNDGDLRVLLADNTSETLALGRRTTDQAVVVAINRSATAQTLSVPTAGFVPDGTSLAVLYETAGTFGEAIPTAEGVLPLTLEPMSGILLATTGDVDLAPPAAPQGLALEQEAESRVSIAWEPSPDAVGYNVYRSPMSGGGWVKVNVPLVTGRSFDDNLAANAKLSYYTVTAVDAAGNESAYSTETAGMAHLAILDAALIEPATLTHTISTIEPTSPVRGGVRVGSFDTVIAELGYGPQGSAPADNPDWKWVEAAVDDTADSPAYAAALLPDHTGTFDYVYRFTSTAGREWVYGDLSGAFTGVPAQPGKLTVNPSSDTAAPASPTGLKVLTASILGVDLQWDPITGDDSLYGYEVGRADSAAGPFTTIALVTEPTAHDPNVTGTAPIFYVVRAVDTSFNRSPDSAPIEAKPGPRPVTIVFNVTIPVPTGAAVGRAVYIAGTLDRLDPTMPQWDPAGVVMTKVDDTHWTVTLRGIEGTNIGYKYVLGDWNYVEKDASCAEISDRPLTVSFGQDGTQVVEDVVLNWRNVDTCPN
jgi:glycosidase